MRRVNAELWAGIAMLVVTVGASSPVLLGFVPTRVPHLIWVAIFVLMLAAVIGALWMSSSRRSVWLFAVAPLAAWAALLTAEGAGLFDIVIVVLAAVSVYLVPWQGTAVLIVLNTAALAVSAWLQQSSPVSLVAVSALYFVLQVGAALSSMSLLTEQRMRRELAAAHIDLQATTALLAAESRASERLRISRDLHDSIGHHLTVLNLQLEAAKHSAPDATPEHVSRASDVAKEVLAQLRGTVGDLRDENESLAESLTPMLSGLHGVEVSMDIDPDIRLEPAVHMAAVRVVQEAVTNTLRHADASRIDVSVQVEADAVKLTVHDNGRGGQPMPGMGLVGIRERVEHLGGTVEIDGSDGFRVSGRIPT